MRKDFLYSLVILISIFIFSGCQQNTSLPQKKVIDENDKFVKYKEFHDAIANNSLEQLKKAFEKNPIGIDTIVHKRGSLLYIALRGVETIPQAIYREDIVHYLVEEKHANVNLILPDGFSAVIGATNSGLKGLKYLESKGALVKDVYVNSKGKSQNVSLLHFAAQSPKGVEIIEYLLTKGYSVNVKSTIGTTPLISAITYKNFNNVKYLVEHGADVEVKYASNWTPLLLSVYQKEYNVVKYLVAHGANVNVKNQEGWTPLLLAVYNNEEEIVKYLVEHGANVNTKNKEGWSPLLSSTYYGYKSILEYLISKEANPFDKVQNYGAIAYANFQKHTNLIPILKKAQNNYANIQIKNIVQNFETTKNYEALKKYIDTNPKSVYYIQDDILRLALTGPKNMKVGDVRKLLQNGRSEKIIISLIKQVSSPYKKFTLDEIDVLIKMGLSDNVISAMIDVTTQLLRDEKLRKQQEALIAEQQKIANQKQKVIVKERIIEKRGTDSNGNPFVEAVGKEIGKELGKEIGRKILDSLF